MMKVKILGSGGSISMPRALCNCENCSRAREKGIPYARTGPSLFLEEESVLFDTPEEIRIQIERENIKRIKHVFYTHWHLDHTQGLRIFEHINFRYPGEEKKEPVNVYIPENAIRDFKRYCQAVFYCERMGYVNINNVKDRVPIKIGKITITPLDFKRRDRVRYGYLIEQAGKRVVYAPCSVLGLVLDKYYENLDLFLVEAGWFGDTGSVRARLPENHPWHEHISFEESLDIIRKIRPKKTVLVHIDGGRHLGADGNHDFLLEVTGKHRDLNMGVSHDGMEVVL